MPPLNIFRSIAQISEGLTKGGVEGFSKGFAATVDLARGAKDLAILLNTFDKLFDRLTQLRTIGQLFADLVSARTDAELMYGKVIAAVNSDDGKALFTDEDRERLGTGVFTYDLATAVKGTLEYQNLRDNAADIMGAFVQNTISGTSDFIIALREFANAGISRLKLDLERNQALSNVIIGGVQYLNAQRVQQAADRALRVADSDPLRIRNMNTQLVLQRLSLRDNLLQLMNDVCNAYFYANLERCPIADTVLKGERDAELVTSARRLRLDFSRLPVLPQTVKVRIIYRIAEDGTVPDELAGLRQNGTLSFQVNASTRQFLGYYGVGIDLIGCKFDNIRIEPPVAPDGEPAQVRVTIASDGFSNNTNSAREAFSFRGPATLRGTVFVPATGEVVVRGDIYPGDAYQYYKPSPFNDWQLRVNPRAQNDPEAFVNTSDITRAEVTFEGRGFLYPDLRECPALDEEPVYLPSFDKHNCSQAHLCKRKRPKCRALANELQQAKSQLCQLHEGFCVEVLIE